MLHCMLIFRVRDVDGEPAGQGEAPRRWKDKRGLGGRVLRDFHVNLIQVAPNDAEEQVCEI